MAPKSNGKDKEKLIDEGEEVLQAVVLADSWNRRFRPLTLSKPRCLLPICNVPLLDWTFESLALAGVQEVFVLTRSHSGQVKKAISDSKWSKPGSGMKIIPVMTAKETFSPGDAMRDIYTRGLVTSDFVLVMGDLVSNIRIDEVVRVHKERRKTNKDVIMTMVVKEASVEHRSRSKGESAVFVVDPQTSECLHYESVLGYPRPKIVNVPREVLASRKEVEIRYDLIDCGIDVCSVEVPSLFQDNFDYLDLRRDFVHGVLTSDLLMKNIHLYVEKDGYAARVRDTRSYESVSKDILSRWTFPLVPDDNFPGDTRYEHTRGNRYLPKIEGNVAPKWHLARNARVGANTIIGDNSFIDDGVEIKYSIIGAARIGYNSLIENSYIFDGAIIGENCRISNSIIGANAHIKENSVIERGCLVGDNVVLGPGAKLSPLDRVSVSRDRLEALKKGWESQDDEEEEEDSDIEEIEDLQDSLDISKLGPDTNAILWPHGPREDEDEDDSGDENVESYKNLRFMRMAEDVKLVDNFAHDADKQEIKATIGASPVVGARDAEKEFRSEVVQSLERAFAENHSLDNAAVELKTLRMASNVPLGQVKEAVITTLVDRISIIEDGGAAQRQAVHVVLARWGQLINRLGGADPVETIHMLQRHCISSPRLSLFGQILAALYQYDVVEEEDIHGWHHSAMARGLEAKHPDEQELLKKTWLVGGQLIVQLAQQSSDEEDSDEEASAGPNVPTSDEESEEESD